VKYNILLIVRFQCDKITFSQVFHCSQNAKNESCIFFRFIFLIINHPSLFYLKWTQKVYNRRSENDVFFLRAWNGIVYRIVANFAFCVISSRIYVHRAVLVIFWCGRLGRWSMGLFIFCESRLFSRIVEKSKYAL